MPQKTGAATIRDVAKRAKVSVATVSRVINKTATISPDTLERVHQAISELNFVPSSVARSLSSHRTNVIGLLLPLIGWDNYFPPLLRGVETAVYEGGFDLLINSQRNTPTRRLPVGTHNTDGLLLFTDCIEDSDIAQLQAKGFPLVLLHRTPPNGLEIPHVVFANKPGAKAIVEHLIEAHGCRRIAFLAGPEHNEDSYWREQGYYAALEAHGIPIDPALIAMGGFHEAVAQDSVERWLAQGVRIDAIFAGDDESAIGAMMALQSAGLRIPQDIAVVGFDDVPLARLLNPPLTTVHTAIEDAGYRAGQMLVQRINTGATETRLVLPTGVAIRQSCGCK